MEGTTAPDCRVTRQLFTAVITITSTYNFIQFQFLPYPGEVGPRLRCDDRNQNIES